MRKHYRQTSDLCLGEGIAENPSAVADTSGGTHLVPTPEQLAWQKEGLGVFFHFGINTFAGLEWSDGTLSPEIFDPTDLDADEWVRTASEFGAQFVVLTAKHHDGFCLWPTATTDYSVASSPWRDGRGDVVREVEQACRAQGMRLGLYLSPWDRHDPRYADPEAYDDLYLAQLRELCTHHGDLHELWFDGAGSAEREYAWDRIGALIAELQPGAKVFTMGPATIRWVGNEDGLAADPVRYVMRSADLNNYDTDVIETAEARYLPPECDVSLRKGWFWQEGEEPKSLGHLLAIHDRSIGLGANLLLNIPPDRRGRIDPADAARIGELSAALHARFGAPVELVLETGSTTGAGFAEGPGGPDGAVHRLRAVLPGRTRFDHIELRESLEGGQRVVGHRVTTHDGEVLAEGGSIGVRRIHRLESAAEADAIVVELVGEGAALDAVLVHDADDAPVPDLSDFYAATTAPPEAG